MYVPFTSMRMFFYIGIVENRLLFPFPRIVIFLPFLSNNLFCHEQKVTIFPVCRDVRRNDESIRNWVAIKQG